MSKRRRSRRKIPRMLLAWRKVALAIVSAGALGASVIASDTYGWPLHFHRGRPSPQEVRAPRTTVYEDREATEVLRRRAAERVPPVYVFDETALDRARSALDGGFERALSQGKGEGVRWLKSLDAASLNSVKERIRNVISSVMGDTIRADEPSDMARAQTRVTEAVKAMPVPQSAWAVLTDVGHSALTPNTRYDAAAHEERRKQAAAAMERVRRVIKRGTVILKQGQTVTDGHLALLRALGLTSPRPSPWRMAGVVILAVLAVALTGVWLRRFEPSLYEDDKRLILLALLLIFPPVTVVALKSTGMRDEQVWLMLAPASVMMISGLLRSQVATICAVIQAGLAGIAGGNQLAPALTTLGSSLTALCLVGHMWPAAHFFWMALSLAGTNALLVLAVGWLSGAGALVVPALAGGVYGLGAVALAVGGMALLQRPFDIASQVRLLELANPNHPLLKRLLTEAPGTYADSFMVANLAEQAAEAVGADTLLARVGAYYHDIGKLRAPRFFYENQALLGMENVHEQLSPSLSSIVITSHVKHGLELAQEYHLPTAIKEIVEQHHGTDLIRFFYHRAREAEGAEHVSEERFRYPGPKPRTKEAAIVMLADSVLGAVWSLPQKTPSRVHDLAEQMVVERVRNGQLGESPLTLRDLSVITEVFQRTLHSTLFRERPEYPTVEPKAVVLAGSHSTTDPGADRQAPAEESGADGAGS